MLSTEWVLIILEKWHSWAILLSLLISTLVAISGVMPSIFVTSANVLFFGIYNGLIISWLGEIIGAGISFKLYRWGFKKRTENIGSKYLFINQVTQAQGNKITILIFQARLLPYVPSGLVTLAGAVSNMPLLPFMLATALGKLPSITLEVLIAYKIIQLNSLWVATIFTAILIITIVVMFKNKK
ncbi:MAG: VTT domain-containing protein [Clostridia bacterium]|jgi:uncharacterized membrane protein YdjX (TVP38/TMEM64 family)|nr:VTT domain-containing protein [Clostridia bacterium]